MSKAEERGKTYALHKASEKLHHYYGNAMLSVVQFDGYDIKNAYIDGYNQAEKDVLDAIERELTRRMLEDYNEGVEEDEIAQGCMASLIMFVRQMKEK